MANLDDDIFTGTIVGMILGIPILIGIAILAIPFIIISCLIDVPMEILLLNLSVFVIAVLLVWLFSKVQIIENGIVGLIVGSLVYIYFKWHSLVCILIGVAIIGFLFFVSYIKIGFWIKTILFSMIVTFLLFMIIYSDEGFFPLPDMIWKVTFFIVFFLENIFIRCATAYNKGFLFAYARSKKREDHYNSDFAQKHSEWNKSDSQEHKENNKSEKGKSMYFAGVDSAESLRKRYHDLIKIYHPDNQNGDTTASKQIQQEYDDLMKRFNS